MRKIEWTDATWNPVVGCSKVSLGCANCYAERMAGRLANMNQRPYQDVTCANGNALQWRGEWNGLAVKVDSAIEKPLHWRKPRKVFVCSMGDLFHESVPFEWIDRVWAVMALAQQHTFQVLTKRPGRMAEYLASRTAIDDSGRVGRMPQWYNVITCWLDQGDTGFLGKRWDACHDAASLLDGQSPLPNVWLGTTTENQATADERIPHLLRCPAPVRFVSVEPMLGPVNLSPWIGDVVVEEPYEAGSGKPVLKCADVVDEFTIAEWIEKLDWVICGGESGPSARPMHPDWARDLRDQCTAAGVPFFFKQWGAWSPVNAETLGGSNVPGRTKIHTYFVGGTDQYMARVGKKAAGRLLDGRTWDEYPREKP